MGGTSSLLSFAELYARSIDKEKCSYVSVLAVFRSPKGCLRVLVSAMLRKRAYLCDLLSALRLLLHSS